MVELRRKTIKIKKKETSHFYVLYKTIYADFTLNMTKNQAEIVDKRQLKESDLGRDILEKYTPKKDLNRKAANYMQKHLTVRGNVLFDTCSDYMSFLTNGDLSKKRTHKIYACKNRFCPICTWRKAKKDAIKLSVMLKAIKEIEGKEYLFLTLTARNCSGEELSSEINRFNKAIKRLFERKNVQRIVKGYVRKLEVTTDQERYITGKLYKRKQAYFDKRGLKEGDLNPQYNTYNPHVHMIVAVNKSYFNKGSEYISQSEWLSMWQECMDDMTITQVDVKKVRSSGESENKAVLEIAKYSAKGSDLYHSEAVFDTFYTALKKRQLLVYSVMMKDYSKKYENGELDRFKENDETIYTHFLTALWKGSKYENALRSLSPEEFKEFNKRALDIEESD